LKKVNHNIHEKMGHSLFSRLVFASIDWGLRWQGLIGGGIGGDIN